MYKIIIKNNNGDEVENYSASSKECLVTIGKDNGNNIVLRDPSISGQHLALILNGKKIVIRNLKSRNGILLNGERIKKEQIQANSTDEIKIGDFFVTLIWEESPSDAEGTNKRSFINKLLAIISFIFIIIFIYIFFKPREMLEVKISEPIKLTESTVSQKSEIKAEDSWRIKLSKAKDAYFNDNILEAAKLFKEVLHSFKETLVIFVWFRCKIR